MAADFTALLAHALTWPQIEALPAVLNERWSGEMTVPLRRSSRSMPGWSFGPRTSPDQSLQTEFQSSGYLLLKGPDGFDGQVFARVFELYNWTRWWSFISNPAVRTSLRQTCRLLAEALGTKTVIYLPDSHYAGSGARDLPFRGADLPAIAAWLAQNAGPPAASIEAIAATDNPASREVNGYYIETF